MMPSLATARTLLACWFVGNSYGEKYVQAVHLYDTFDKCETKTGTLVCSKKEQRIMASMSATDRGWRDYPPFPPRRSLLLQRE